MSASKLVYSVNIKLSKTIWRSGNSQIENYIKAIVIICIYNFNQFMQSNKERTSYRMAHWNNTLEEDEECDIIEEMMQENDIEVYHDDEKKLKHFTVKGEGLFECEQCNSRWTSHRTTIKVNLFLQRVSKKYQQRCKECENWVTPLFTSEISLKTLSMGVYIHWTGLATGLEHWTGLLDRHIFGFYTCCGWFNWFSLATGSLQPITKW